MTTVKEATNILFSMANAGKIKDIHNKEEIKEFILCGLECISDIAKADLQDRRY